MKSKKKIRKLEFNKETIARLGENDLNLFRGGQETDKRTKRKDTCTCFTNGTEVDCV